MESIKQMDIKGKCKAKDFKSNARLLHRFYNGVCLHCGILTTEKKNPYCEGLTFPTILKDLNVDYIGGF